MSKSSAVENSATEVSFTTIPWRKTIQLLHALSFSSIQLLLTRAVKSPTRVTALGSIDWPCTADQGRSCHLCQTQFKGPGHYPCEL